MLEISPVVLWQQLIFSICPTHCHMCSICGHEGETSNLHFSSGLHLLMQPEIHELPRKKHWTGNILWFGRGALVQEATSIVDIQVHKELQVRELQVHKARSRKRALKLKNQQNYQRFNAYSAYLSTLRMSDRFEGIRRDSPHRIWGSPHALSAMFSTPLKCDPSHHGPPQPWSKVYTDPESLWHASDISWNPMWQSFLHVKNCEDLFSTELGNSFQVQAAIDSTFPPGFLCVDKHVYVANEMQGQLVELGS